MPHGTQGSTFAFWPRGCIGTGKEAKVPIAQSNEVAIDERNAQATIQIARLVTKSAVTKSRVVAISAEFAPGTIDIGVQADKLHARRVDEVLKRRILSTSDKLFEDSD